MKNWKTTLGGILAAVGLALTANSNAIIHTAGICVAAIGTLLAGTAAADSSNTIQKK